MWIIVYKEDIYRIIGDEIYNLNNNIGIIDNTVNIPNDLNVNECIINANEKIDYKTVIVSRYPTTYNNNWKEYSYSTDGIGFCAHHAKATFY